MTMNVTSLQSLAIGRAIREATSNLGFDLTQKLTSCM